VEHGALLMPSWPRTFLVCNPIAMMPPAALANAATAREKKAPDVVELVGTTFGVEPVGLRLADQHVVVAGSQELGGRRGAHGPGRQRPFSRG
jgi:hypothetical protein